MAKTQPVHLVVLLTAEPYDRQSHPRTQNLSSFYPRCHRFRAECQTGDRQENGKRGGYGCYVHQNLVPPLKPDSLLVGSFKGVVDDAAPFQRQQRGVPIPVRLIVVDVIERVGFGGTTNANFAVAG